MRRRSLAPGLGAGMLPASRYRARAAAATSRASASCSGPSPASGSKDPTSGRRSSRRTVRSPVRAATAARSGTGWTSATAARISSSVAVTGFGSGCRRMRSESHMCPALRSGPPSSGGARASLAIAHRPDQDSGSPSARCRASAEPGGARASAEHRTVDAVDGGEGRDPRRGSASTRCGWDARARAGPPARGRRARRAHPTPRPPHGSPWWSARHPVPRRVRRGARSTRTGTPTRRRRRCSGRDPGRRPPARRGPPATRGGQGRSRAARRTRPGSPQPRCRAAPATASASARAVGEGRPRRQPGGALRQVLVPAGEIRVAQPAADQGVLHDDGAPALAVPAARREAGDVEDPCECRVGHRLGGEVTHGRGGGEAQAEFHGVEATSSADRPGRCWGDLGPVGDDGSPLDPLRGATTGVCVLGRSPCVTPPG